MKKQKTKGKLIVIDGTDGSGKATQVKYLTDHLKKDGYKIKIVDFPEYYKNFFGAFVGHCLSEQYYNFINVHPKIASVLFAADRWQSKKEMDQWIKEGYIIIANRYVSANQIHQGGKISDTKKRNSFIKWLNQMEYEEFGIPKPDITIYLSLPIQIVMKLLNERESSQMKRKYLKKNKDVHEADEKFMENSIKSALWLAKTQPNWSKINCSEKGEILSREQIHEMVYKEVKKVLK
ncbi:MAG: deoxynucleoside kinase [Candidatus Paceibacterota bacterium]|jgi:dTMP kinase